jgi:hypothetical protein
MPLAGDAHLNKRQLMVRRDLGLGFIVNRRCSREATFPVVLFDWKENVVIFKTRSGIAEKPDTSGIEGHPRAMAQARRPVVIHTGSFAIAITLFVVVKTT